MAADELMVDTAAEQLRADGTRAATLHALEARPPLRQRRCIWAAIG